MAFIKVPLIEDKLDINVRVYNLTLTSFLAEIMENYIVELEDHVKKSGLHVKKNKFHCNELKKKHQDVDKPQVHGGGEGVQGFPDHPAR